jgi:hypothetical protein
MPSRAITSLAVFLPVLLLAQTGSTRLAWEFDDGPAGWHGARHLEGVEVRDGILHGHATGHDPQLISPLFSLPATPYQQFVARVRFSKGGKAALFYSNTTEGQYGGFSGKKVIEEPVVADEWITFRVRPFWQAEKQIVHVRFDPPPNADVDVDWIRIEELAPAGDPVRNSRIDLDPNAGWHQDAAQRWMAPPLRIPVKGRDWLRIALPPSPPGHLEIRWTTDVGAGLQTTSTFLAADGWAHVYDFDLSANSSWKGELIYADIRATVGKQETVRPLWLEVADQPLVTPDIRCLALTPQEAANRVGKPCTFLLRFLNAGGGTALDVRASISFADADGNTLSGNALNAQIPAALSAGFALSTDLPKTFLVTVTPTRTGAIIPRVTVAQDGQSLSYTGRAMQVLPPASQSHADYVPEPKPAETDYLIATYYYPGYGAARQHREMLRSAPWAKPALGYYDEANPECIDWQIKWAVEHGIGAFLVDWYWVQGRTHHMHWLEGFAKARYRSHLKWAVMWANHNPPNTHSREDWRNVTEFWIDNYFQTPEYLRIDGKPVVAIWAPGNIRRDLGGGDGAKELLAMSQSMAREAGLPGIHFVAMNNGGEPAQLRAEGYETQTYYHWWGDARETSLDRDYVDYADVVSAAPAAWQKTGKSLQSGGLGFLPVADTGWDARPRHGDNTFVIHNRTPELFRQTLADAKQWLDRNDQRLLVLGPWNEWTEGSYIEPCAEWDFRMLEAVRSVFCNGPPPQSVTPRDLGLGPYDFELSEEGSSERDWDFAGGDAHGWRPLMGLQDFAPTPKGLVMTSTTRDPAIYSPWLSHDSESVTEIEIALQVSPAPSTGSKLAVFWETERSPINSRAVVEVPLRNDTDEHVYRVNLAEHPRWRGRLRRLRIDPCQAAGQHVTIRRIRLLP